MLLDICNKKAPTYLLELFYFMDQPRLKMIIREKMQQYNKLLQQARH